MKKQLYSRFPDHVIGIKRGCRVCFWNFKQGSYTEMRAIWLSLAVAVFSGGAFGNSACDKPRDDFDGLYCLNKVYLEGDAELNANYKKLMAILDSNGSTALKKGQLAWIERRNSSCSRRDGDGFFVNLNCATKQTINRAQFLQDRYRECVSSGCQNSKL